MMFPSGQPLWQKGMPQSMQRAAWARSSSSGNLPSSSRQSRRRSSTGRRAGTRRSNSMKPVILPTVAALLESDARQLRRVAVQMLSRQNLPVLGRHHLPEVPGSLLPAREDAPGDGALGQIEMTPDELVDARLVLLAHRLDLDHAAV